MGEKNYTVTVDSIQVFIHLIVSLCLFIFLFPLTCSFIYCNRDNFIIASRGARRAST
jgi:hypothetical protein